MLQVRIEAPAAAVISALIQRNGLYPAYAGRSATFAVNELLKQASDFKTADAQAKSEKNPRPGQKR